MYMEFYDFLLEMPIGKIEKIGNWQPDSKLHKWKKTDVKLLTSDKGIEKIKSKWNKFPFLVDIYLVKKPTKDPVKFIGERDEDFIRKNFDRNFVVNENAINIFFTNNISGNNKFFSSWIMAHRFAHAMLRFYPYESFIKRVFYEIKNILERYYKFSPKLTSFSNFSAFDFEHEKIVRKFMSAIGTFKSARDNKIDSVYEFCNELTSQYIIEGKVRLNDFPLLFKATYKSKSEDMYKRYSMQTRSFQLDSDIEKDEIYMDQIKLHKDSFEIEINSLLNDVFQSCIGGIFCY